MEGSLREIEERFDRGSHTPKDLEKIMSDIECLVQATHIYHSDNDAFVDRVGTVADRVRTALHDSSGPPTIEDVGRRMEALASSPAAPPPTRGRAPSPADKARVAQQYAGFVGHVIPNVRDASEADIQRELVHLTPIVERAMEVDNDDVHTRGGQKVQEL
jgi:hypothetical protein